MCQLTKLWRPSCYSGSKLIGLLETTQFDWSSQIDRVVWVLINNENRGLTLTSPKWVTFYGFRDLSYLIWKITSTWSDLTCSTLHLHLYVYCMCTVLDLIIDLDQLYSYCFGCLYPESISINFFKVKIWKAPLWWWCYVDELRWLLTLSDWSSYDGSRPYLDIPKNQSQSSILSIFWILLCDWLYGQGHKYVSSLIMILS